MHAFLPNRQTDLPTRLYPLLLRAVLAIGIAGWVVSLFRSSSSLAKWKRNAPLIGAATMLLAVWDLITLKFAVWPLPYFPGPDMVPCGLRCACVPIAVRLLTGKSPAAAASAAGGTETAAPRCIQPSSA